MAADATGAAFGAVIFDMDGLVLDSEPAYAQAWRQAAAGFAVHLEDAFLRDLFGRHAGDVERALAEKIGPAFDRGVFRGHAGRAWRAHVERHGIAAMPGLDAILAALARLGIPYALATNSDGPYAAHCLRLAGLETRFPVVVTRDQVAEGKPAPDLFIAAARRLGQAAERCLVLEDSATGLLAARRAGAIPWLVLARPAPAESQALAARAFRSLGEVAGHLLGDAAAQ